MRNIPICRMVFEELCLRFSGILHTFFCIDILLAAVYTPNEAEFEGIDTSSEDIESVSTCIHQVQFGQDTNGATSLRIYCTCKFEGIGVGEVNVGGGYGQNDAVVIFIILCKLNSRIFKPIWF